MAGSVIIFGYDQLLLAAIDSTQDAGIGIAAVVFPSTRNDTNANAIRDEVGRRGFEILEMTKEAGFVEELRMYNPDLFLVWSFPMILPREIFSIPAKGTVNVHPGLLPEYRGVNGIRWALLNGEEQTGVTMHYIDGGIDSGDMIARVAFPIEEADDIRTLMIKSRSAGMAVIKRFLPLLLNGEVQAQKQDASAVGYYSAKMTPDRAINWDRPSKAIRDHIRAFAYPFEGATATFGEELVKVTSAKLTEIGSDWPPGSVISCDEAGLLVATTDNAILLK